ncbi:MAG TPA: YbaN family protein [Iamia sp.]
MRAAWVAVGCVAVGLGTIGIVVPGWPTTVFFVVAAWAFSKSSPRLEQWVLTRPGVGPLVRDYRAGLGMPRRAKVIAITMLVVSCGLSATFGVERLAVRLAIVGAGAIGVAWILWRIPTREVVVGRSLGHSGFGDQEARS